MFDFYYFLIYFIINYNRLVNTTPINISVMLSPRLYTFLIALVNTKFTKVVLTYWSNIVCIDIYKNRFGQLKCPTDLVT